MTELTEAEIERLTSVLPPGSVSRGWLATEVERIIDARLAPIRALADEMATDAAMDRACQSWRDSDPAAFAHGWNDAVDVFRAALSAPLTAPDATDGPQGRPDADGLREAAAWVAAIGYPVDFGSSVRMPDALWEALVDHVHADQTGEWHGNTLDREDTASWLAEEAGR